VTISTSTSWVATPPNAAFNYQFADLTIGSGATLVVPSGLVIRVTGTFTNNGTITVSSYGQGGVVSITGSSSAEARYTAASRGVAPASAGFGERAVGGNNVLGGFAASGLGSANIAASILKPGVEGGGAGAGALSGPLGDQSGAGALGGGTLTILAQGRLSNPGLIVALGGDAQVPCSGGGGGGVVIFASKTSITNTGNIVVSGGGGGASSVSCGAGGGGGGGLVQLIAPTVTSTGTMFLAGGPAGAAGATGSVTGTAVRMGGGGGGACFGNGGIGGGITGNDPRAAAAAGATGAALIRNGVDPTALF
jgi:hypothetical protein